MSNLSYNMTSLFAGAPTLVVATMGLMEELIALMGREISLVTQRKLAEHAVLLKRKQKLAMDYRANIKSLAAAPQLLQSLAGEAKDVLRRLAKKLETAAQTNAQALSAIAQASEQLIQNIVAMVKTESLPKSGYKNLATAHLQLGTYSPTCPPLAVSRSV